MEKFFKKSIILIFSITVLYSFFYFNIVKAAIDATTLQYATPGDSSSMPVQPTWTDGNGIRYQYKGNAEWVVMPSQAGAGTTYSTFYLQQPVGILGSGGKGMPLGEVNIANRYDSAYAAFITSHPSSNPSAFASSPNKQGKYFPLEPGAFPGVTNTSNLGVFLGQVFKWAIALAVALSLIVTIWGGIEYMTTDSWWGKDDAKTKWKNAAYGLGLALVSYLLLYTINPALVTFQGNTLINPKNTNEANTNIDADINTNSNNSGVTSNNDTNNSGAGESLRSGANSSVVGSGSNSNTPQSPCIDCVDIINRFNVKSDIPGNRLNSNLANRLEAALAGQNVQITDAFPPAPIFPRAACHGNGTCADINFTNYSTNVNDVRNLYNSLISAGLRPSYEVVDKSLCQPYEAAGIPCTSYPQTNGSHFHVEL